MNKERMYTILVAPHFSEKSSNVGDNSNQYVFEVARNATKIEIREAVETLFEVEVTHVSTLNKKGKNKRTARGVSRTKSWKKAYVRLAAGQDIDFEAVG